jgi:hypothetical protein
MVLVKEGKRDHYLGELDWEDESLQASRYSLCPMTVIIVLT